MDKAKAVLRIEEAFEERNRAAELLHKGGWGFDADKAAAHACGLHVALDILKAFPVVDAPPVKPKGEDEESMAFNFDASKIRVFDNRGK